MEEIKIDEYKCEDFQSHREENNWDIPLNECVVKAIEYCKLKDKQLEEKEKQLEKYALCINKINNINNDLLNNLCNNCEWKNTEVCPCEDKNCAAVSIVKQLINGVENALDSN